MWGRVRIMAMIKYDTDQNPYEWALIAAGAEVLVFNAFGSYQGDWLAKVNYQGQIGWIHDYYGSCSVCDAFEADLGYDYGDAGYKEEKVISFAKRYLDEIGSYEEVFEDISKNSSWDMEAQKMMNFMKDNK